MPGMPALPAAVPSPAARVLTWLHPPLSHPPIAVAAQLLIPYLGWVSFATALTYNILQNNPEVSAVPATDSFGTQ